MAVAYAHPVQLKPRLSCDLDSPLRCVSEPNSERAERNSFQFGNSQALQAQRRGSAVRPRACDMSHVIAHAIVDAVCILPY